MTASDTLASALNGANIAYLADLYARWVQDHKSVDVSFAQLFDSLEEEEAAVLKDAAGASWAPHASMITGEEPEAPAKGAGAADGLSAQHSLALARLVRAYRTYGHMEANLDPLGLKVPQPHEELDPATYGFSKKDMSLVVYVGALLEPLLKGPSAKVGDVVAALRSVYCHSIGAEYTYARSHEEREWFRKRFEGDNWQSGPGADEQKLILKDLTEAEGFEAFCQKRYVGAKRFGLEGGEVSIPSLHAIINRAAGKGVKSVTIGMAHRGRLNTLANIVRKPYVAIFNEFSGGAFKPDDVAGSGDVKYHLGSSTDIEVDGHSVHITLQPNPSHLEAVDPVVCGKVRAIQDDTGDTEHRSAHMGIVIHGDAAFAGQGIVYETLSMSRLKGYRTGGTIHMVVNNQIGFTTNQENAHSGIYNTDVAKAIQAPVLHVNGDDAEAVIYASRLAEDYRQAFASDIVLDIVCYRRHGHNEIDEPTFTQPVMYKAIAEHETPHALYAKRLVAAGVVTDDEVKAQWDAFAGKLDADYQAAQSYKVNKADWLEGSWLGLHAPSGKAEDVYPETGIALDTLKTIGAALSTTPESFDVNSKIARQLRAKADMFENGTGFDWATGEALGFGSLLLEKHRVRLSGEDCQRGTFSQRHAVLTDQDNQTTYTPLNNICDDQAQIEIWNSFLSEYGVLGFEYGYSLRNPQALVLWEAQFGDFANCAQVIIDQFIASGETKWLRMSGLVMLLPHGYEGQGPEHSSARLERYLQLCAENNMFVCNITTPANYFHALRRQLKLDYRKPMILMEPKSLLRHKLAVSELADFGPGTRFEAVLGEVDKLAADKDIERVVLCSGKVYYDLLAERRDKELDNVAIVRLEQLYPFPETALAKELKRYPNAEVIWCQEETENGGAWLFADRRIESALTLVKHKAGRPVYVGRAAAASPATGLARIHAVEQTDLVERALGLKK
ncbi:MULTISPECIES: 2-oxoglutarate dehydrogenase E1 component [Acetobacter]|uniref:2-oxoglutarate dehydrogenase E1 component n=1 Tax=Acetobacter TaxID=434 RepID=UPI000A3CBADB|nr:MULTISPECIES: 2-oxoglutarate dehydrogenase E1 component [Acetobacter]MBS0959947.1 2-oxoglutarate dehydrogenase E1 component [Acetobacter thailandicus]MBS0979276.1 2-oxoglutarate dehydrogenase E1 component [Acetobacter thailandicus]OUI89015.1 2-oxoglutarate dehydrogenase [Acetobacter sp. DmW_043]OUJ09617.1 2-oxoglutarate dehydrogenase [Acetobacter sp. DsW_059]